MKTLFFDTETTGVPRDYRAPLTDGANWPRLVQLGWTDGQEHQCCIVRPDGFEIPMEASAIHGITNEHARLEGHPLAVVLGRFMAWVALADLLVGHNLDFDLAIMGAELYRLGQDDSAEALAGKPRRCTMKAGTDFCRLPGRYGYKWPTLGELYLALFDRDLAAAHRADLDVAATVECYVEMEKRGMF